MDFSNSSRWSVMMNPVRLPPAIRIPNSLAELPSTRTERAHFNKMDNVNKNVISPKNGYRYKGLMVRLPSNVRSDSLPHQKHVKAGERSECSGLLNSSPVNPFTTRRDFFTRLPQKTSLEVHRVEQIYRTDEQWRSLMSI